jgi:hypothetical protein
LAFKKNIIINIGQVNPLSAQIWEDSVLKSNEHRMIIIFMKVCWSICAQVTHFSTVLYVG